MVVRISHNVCDCLIINCEILKVGAVSFIPEAQSFLERQQDTIRNTSPWYGCFQLFSKGTQRVAIPQAFKFFLPKEKFCVICKNFSQNISGTRAYFRQMKADCFSYTNILKTLRNDAANYLFLSLSGSKSSRFWHMPPYVSYWWPN